MGTTFLKAIVICLLSSRGYSEENEIAFEKKYGCNVTLKKDIIHSKLFETPAKPTRQSDRLSGNSNPSFVSGYDEEGLPIYSIIRVVSQEDAAEIEHEIAIKEEKGYQKQTSEMTLVE